MFNQNLSICHFKRYAPRKAFLSQGKHIKWGNMSFSPHF